MADQNAAMFSLKIIATNKVFFDGRVRCLVVPTIDGQRAVLAHHEEMLVAVDVGELSFQQEDGTWESAAVGFGSLQVAHNRAIILVDTAETADEIDERRAEEAKERAMEKLRQKQSVAEYKMTQASMARALTRLRIKSKYL